MRVPGKLEACLEAAQQRSGRRLLLAESCDGRMGKLTRTRQMRIGCGTLKSAARLMGRVRPQKPASMVEERRPRVGTGPRSFVGAPIGCYIEPARRLASCGPSLSKKISVICCHQTGCGLL